MGTHPIFESYFDCLTECSLVSPSAPFATRAPATRAFLPIQRPPHQSKLQTPAQSAVHSTPCQWFSEPFVSSGACKLPTRAASSLPSSNFSKNYLIYYVHIRPSV